MRSPWRVVAGMAAACALSGAAWAQDGPAEGARRWETRRVERQADRLGLAGEAREAFLRLHRELDEKVRAAREACDKAVRDLLTPEQREKLDAAKRNPLAALGDLGGLGEQLGGLGGQLGGLQEQLGKALEGAGDRLGELAAGGLSAKKLAADLGLTPEQEGKIAEILKESGKDAIGAVSELDLSDPAKIVEQAEGIRKKQEESRKKRDERIRALLDDTQRRKYDEAAKKAEEAGPAMVRSFGLAIGPDGEARVFGGEEGGDGPPAGLGGFLGGAPGIRIHRAGGDGARDEGRAVPSADRVKGDLRLGAEEELVILPLIERILDAERAHAGWRRGVDRELRAALTSGAGAEALRTKLADRREREAAHRASLKALRDELRGLVTVEQEAVLLGYGVLD